MIGYLVIAKYGANYVPKIGVQYAFASNIALIMTRIVRNAYADNDVYKVEFEPQSSKIEMVFGDAYLTNKYTVLELI